MKRLLLLSNGHGEDLSGALLARELQRLGSTVEALPLVGHGHAYRQAGIPVLGHTREYSTGGLGYTSLRGRLTELRQGQLAYLLGRLARLLRSRHDLIVVVGDVLPLLGAWLSGRPSVIYLVAYSSHYEGRLRLPWPCGWLLRRRRSLRVWSRDALTASDLSEQLGRTVEFLGNPFLDPVARPPAPISGHARQTLGLLPGSRLPEAERNLALMLAMLERLPEALAEPGRLALQAALVDDLQPGALARMAAPLGWRLETGQGDADGQAPQVLVRGLLRLQLHWRRFAAVLHGSDLLVSMTGTAAEQAVGLGKPVLQLEGEGPQFTPGFAEAQRRLLGPGVLCAPPGPEHLAAGAALAVSLLQRLSAEESGVRWRQELAQLGRERIGSPGGTARQAAAIMESLPSSSGR
ncbi:MAG: lipid-A-disaccharide synthase-related protein [Synechococcus sp.]|nr:lipid-A-disaccharide synthase-related protein [Synechococcus sp.]